MKLIQENNNHIFISGQTRSGKTFFACRALGKLSCGVIFINLQDEKLPDNFVIAKAEEITTKQMIKLLKAGAKIDLRIPFNEKLASEVIYHIFNTCLQAGFTEERHIYIAVDECHLLKGRGLEKAKEAATRGLKRGVRCIFITQRPALCDKTLYTQSAEQFIFFIAPSEKEYLKNKGLNYDECLAHWEHLGKYSYIYYDGFKLEARSSI